MFAKQMATGQHCCILFVPKSKWLWAGVGGWVESEGAVKVQPDRQTLGSRGVWDRGKEEICRGGKMSRCQHMMDPMSRRQRRRRRRRPSGIRSGG